MIDKITRKDFYDLVWSKPLKLIGEDLGMSYSELKKISKEYKIPLPENGFWTKKAFNKDVNVLPLIQYQEVPSEIVLHDDIEEDQTAEPTILQLTKKLEKELGEKTLVPKLIKSWHPLRQSLMNLNRTSLRHSNTLPALSITLKLKPV